METPPATMELTITHRGNAYHINLLSDDTIAMLQSRLEELTSVPPSFQKLLYKGKKPSLKDDNTLAQAGLKDGMKVQMLGSTAEELGGMRAVEDEHSRRERIMRERAAKAHAKVRSTGASSSAASSRYQFHHIEPLPHLPDPPSALALLQRLAADPAIRHIMQKNQLAVGALTELAPHEQPELLGLNVNAGQTIKLRIRTDRYDGFRLYKDIRKVLCHELTHNVWGDHDDSFKEMNSRLNREVAEFERSVSEGTHHLAGLGDVYAPSSEIEAEARTYLSGEGLQVLGGSSSDSMLNETREERRIRLLDATMRRLQKEEEELEQMCGTTKSP
ncbi:uncharacterized protein FIBRA_03417 [Fibroporia radiculosa]|uniref:WLM domain-containing protein n=1 Tax=Fibroporia radiculosa TaxID=599839 RepID=J4HVZ4_9APHY|nr:uncharacterized protein FIBRA_03417 [Fibroporia radiculosa]CCM01367.1 predicted protein [Fibroporia radiculosa]